MRDPLLASSVQWLNTEATAGGDRTVRFGACSSSYSLSHQLLWAKRSTFPYASLPRPVFEPTLPA